MRLCLLEQNVTFLLLQFFPKTFCALILLCLLLVKCLRLNISLSSTFIFSSCYHISKKETVSNVFYYFIFYDMKLCKQVTTFTKALFKTFTKAKYVCSVF
ncbi:unnamed protein product [Clavelina lepadiformis]|uniref:Secreted protein n=1 Tax=Clavelina lepadiformis TaxID=159417 RepID=A0ABP0FXC8_CLALP